MSNQLDEDLAGAVFDEYSLRDTIAMLHRQHGYSDQQARLFLKSRFEAGSFSLYRDADQSGSQEFTDVGADGLDMGEPDNRFIYLTRGQIS